MTRSTSNYASLGALPALLSVGIEDGGGASGITLLLLAASGEVPTENSSHQIDIASFKGSATINFDVMTPPVADTENASMSLAMDTTESINLETLVTQNRVNDVITAQLDVSGQRFKSSISMEFPSGLLTYNIVSETAHGTLSLAIEQPSLV